METAKKQGPPDKRPRVIERDALIYPVEAGELVGISRQQITRLCQLGELPEPGPDGRFPLQSFLTTYIAYVERTARESGAKEAAQRVHDGFFAGL